MQELGVKKPILTNRPGIYAHIIYNPKDPDIVGIYVGAASMLTFGIKRHKIDQKGIARRRKRGKPERRTRHRALTVHQEFWARKGYKDFWLCFAKFYSPSSKKEKHVLDLILNVVEKYAALLLRSLA